MNAEAAPCTLQFAALTDVGTAREHNEDACTTYAEGAVCVLAAVADGVSSAPAGEVASAMALEVLVRAYREEPVGLAAGQRLFRAVQQANIELYDRAIAVPELHGMCTTLTAAVVESGQLTAVHVGDSRLYLIRGREATQLTKDHTSAAEKARFGLMSKERARTHPDRSVITRSLGRELIVNRDRISQPLLDGDVLLVCSDGLYGVLDDGELPDLVRDRSAEEACRTLIDAANARGTPDNLTAAVVRVMGPTPGPRQPGLLRRILGRR